ncbi:MAG: hypothetical protein JW902_09370 [Syntrophaceae bacterium]|nr:hypothetical protein [Syntrophaceae bacterium]
MLFKSSLNTDMEEIKQYLSVSQNGSFDKIKPHIAAAEILFLKELVSDTLYEAVNAYYNGAVYNGPATERQADCLALVPYIQRPLIHFAYYVGADEMGLHITDAGMQIITDETHKQAFQWQVEAAKSSWLYKAHLFSEELLVFLEQNVRDYPTWEASPAFSERIDSLLYTTKLFNDAFFIRNSRRLFLAMKPIIRSIESKYAVPTLSQEYYESLISLLKQQRLTADDDIILQKIRPAIAHLVMAEAVTRFSIEVFPEGVYANLVSSFGTIVAKNPSNKIDKAMVIERLTADGNVELQAVQKYLDAYASDTKYTLYFQSSRYKNPADVPYRAEFENKSDHGILLL